MLFAGELWQKRTDLRQFLVQTIRFMVVPDFNLFITIHFITSF